jgi:hypothetical protein
MKTREHIAGTFVLFLLLILVGCKDLTGPEGPQGSEGEQGAEGFNAGEGPFSFTILSNETGSESLKGLDIFAKALREAIEGLPENAGNTPDNPVELKLTGLDVSQREELIVLYGSLSRYVALDLSACKGILMSAIPADVYPENRAKIVSLKLPGSVAALETYLTKGSTPFGFTGLRALDMPGVRVIGDSAFLDCIALESASFPDVISLGTSAFDGCAALQTVNLPSLGTIRASAFRGCAALAEITLGATPPATVGNLVFQTVTSATAITIKVPSGSVTAYNDWKTTYSSELTGPTLTIAGI